MMKPEYSHKGFVNSRYSHVWFVTIFAMDLLESSAENILASIISVGITYLLATGLLMFTLFFDRFR